MGNDTPQIVIEAAHDAIQAAFKAAFPAFVTVGGYDKSKKVIKCPAAFIELGSIEPGDDPGTDQLAVRLRWEIFLLLRFNTKNVKKSVKQEIRTIVGAVAHFVQGNQFGIPCTPAQFVGAYPDEFSPKTGTYEEWRIDFEMEALLGESVWDGEGIIPDTVMLSYSPIIGIDHEQDYQEVTDDELHPS